MVRLKRMSPNTFIDCILAGRRSFPGIILRGDLTKSPVYEDMQEYLKDQAEKEELKNKPIMITGSHFVQVKAPGLCMPHIHAKRTRFVSSQLTGANFFHGSFTQAYFRHGSLEGADLSHANLSYAILRDINLSADFEGTNLFKTHFGSANLEFAKNLEKSKHLRTVTLHNTRVSVEQRRFIEKKTRGRRMPDPVPLVSGGTVYKNM